MSLQNGQDKQLTDSDMITLGIDFILGMMASANPEVIDPRKWWDRAKTALEVSSDCAENWSHMVSKCGEKLQISSPNEKTSTMIEAISKDMDSTIFERFRYLIKRDSLYIVAMARVVRSQQKEEQKNIKGQTEKLKQM